MDDEIRRVRIEVLGPLRLVEGGTEQSIPEGLPGSLLRLLLAQPNDQVPAAHLASALWPRADAAEAARRLRVVASRLRARLPGGVELRAQAKSYRLHIEPGAMDRLEFEALAARAAEGDTKAATEALTLWHGDPYEDFNATPDVERAHRRLLELRSSVDAVARRSTTGGSASPPVLPTETAAGLLHRPRLLDRLPPAGAVRLIALTAPSGYGKTVLLHQWARREGNWVTWLAAAAGLDGAARATALLDVIDRLSGAGKGFGVVVDDLDQIAEPRFHATLDELLRRGPSDLTIALASRRRLPFPTARLHATGDAVALTPADLAFTGRELALLCPAATEPEAMAADTRRVSDLLRLTHGWPEPTTAIAEALGPSGDRSRLDRALERLATDRGFLGRVLSDLPADLVRFMTDSADLDPLDPALCAAVCERGEPASVLGVLATRHRLVLRTGTQFRHHPLLAELLRRTDAHRQDAPQRHRRAAEWYRQHDQPQRALHHAARADEPKLVASTLAPAIHRAAASGDAKALENWARTIPLDAGIGQTTAELGVLAASLLPAGRRARWHRRATVTISRHISSATSAVDLVRAGRCRAALQSIARARRHSNSRVRSNTAIANTVLSIAEAECHLLLTTRMEALDTALLQRDADAAPWPWLTSWAFGVRAVGAYFSGDAALAAALLDHADARYRRLHPPTEPPPIGWAALTRTLLQFDQAESRAEWERVCTHAEGIVSGADTVGHEPLGVIARYVLAMGRRRSGDADAAALLTDADRRSRRHPDLQLLTAARALLVDDRSAKAPPSAAELSPRERMVLAHLDSDLTLPEIAELLYVSVHTVRAQVRSIYRKLGVTGRAAAIARGLRGRS